MQRTTNQLNKRTNRILKAVQAGTVPAGSDVIAELANLGRALEDAPIKPVVVARLTVTRVNQRKVIVEVWQDATFSNFYHFFGQDGNRRSTKKLIRTANQTEGSRWMGTKHEHKPGLDTIAKRLEFYASQSNPVVSKKIRIMHKRAYRKLISARPDELGLTKTQALPIYRPFAAARYLSPSGSLGGNR